MNVLLLTILLLGTQSMPLKNTTPWVEDDKIIDDIDAFMVEDEIAVDASTLLVDVPKTCKLQLTYARKYNKQNIYTQCTPSVVIITRSGFCKKCNKEHGVSTGTGFFVTKDGVIVTNHHLVDKEEGAFYVTTFDGTTYPVTEILAANEHEDLAIIKIKPSDSKKFTPMPIVTNAPVGTHVSVIGHPDHRFYTLTDGIISRYRKTVPKKWQHAIHYEMMITAPYSPGSSGGPVIDEYGNVVAIVKSREAVGSSKHRGHTHGDLPTQIAYACIPVQRLMKLIEQ